MATSGVLGDLGTIGLEIGKGFINSAFQSSLMAEQNSYARQNAEWSALNMPSLQRQGLENAGYNPLLAVNSATDAYNLGSPSGAGAPQVDLVGAMNASTQRKAQESQADLNETQEDVNDSQKNLNDSQIVNNALRTQADIQNNEALTQAKVALTAAQIHELNARVKGYQGQRLNQDLTNKHLLNTINSQDNLNQMAYERQKNFKENHSWLYKIADLVGDTRRTALGDLPGTSSASNLGTAYALSKLAGGSKKDYINEISYFDKHGKFQGSSVHRKIGGKHK